MKRRLVAAGLVILLPLGMAACGSQSKADACKEINNARDKALEQVTRCPRSLVPRTSRTNWMCSSPSTRKLPRRSPMMT